MRYACSRVRMATQGGLEVICTQKVTIAVVHTAKRGPRETKTINVNYASAFTWITADGREFSLLKPGATNLSNENALVWKPYGMTGYWRVYQGSFHVALPSLPLKLAMHWNSAKIEALFVLMIKWHVKAVKKYIMTLKDPFSCDFKVKDWPKKWKTNETTKSSHTARVCRSARRIWTCRRRAFLTNESPSFWFHEIGN